MRGKGRYKTAQICEGGHVIINDIEFLPQKMSKFCKKCGKPTMKQCKKCSTNIRGRFYVRDSKRLSRYHIPNFCHDCGQSYPWTQSRLQAVKELANEIEQLNEKDKKILISSLDDLIVDTPRTQLAIHQFKKIAQKIGIESANTLKSILIHIVTQAAKEGIWGVGN